MGAACCVAAKDRTITSGSPGETLQRHARYSPTWSFRWDNRVRVAGEETPANWLHNGGCGNDRMEVKSGTTVENAFASEDGSPLDSFRSLAWQKSPLSEGNDGILRLPSSDQAISQNIGEAKEPSDSPSVSYPSPISSLLPFRQFHLYQHLHCLPKATCFLQTRLLQDGITVLQDIGYYVKSLIAGFQSTSHQQSQYLKSHLCFCPLLGAMNRRGAPMVGLRQLVNPWLLRAHDYSEREVLTERSSWGWSSQKMISAGELCCGFCFNLWTCLPCECLEYMTPEINKYDPACPVCTFGEKRAVKMSEKALKAELDSKARKRSRKRVIDSDLSSDIMFDHHKSSGVEGRSPRMSSSSTMKTSIAKPFLRRHFSFGSKTSRSPSDNQPTLRRGFFWARSSKN
ncbi:UNVERIFIED_CONTAM: hypothetical protein Scaly_1353900 [Sesamum calycinum]|uniref:Uncharacterized protein n=1 Tax=Sesamum calycinum TaxID=2727403 RepID=A0AAW2PNJ8_9LAMI